MQLTGTLWAPLPYAVTIWIVMTPGRIKLLIIIKGSSSTLTQVLSLVSLVTTKKAHIILL